jgi:hypothetical protein
MVQASLVQDQRRNAVQKEIERAQEEGSVHLQVTNGKDKTENKKSVYT